MKRMLSLTAILLCALLAFGACTDTPELSDVPSEPTASESSEQPFELELAIEREANASLREEVRRKERVLQNAQVENTSLSNRISVLERELSAALEESERLAAQLTALQSSTKKRMRPLGNGAVLVYADNGQLYGGLLADEMKVVYEDGAEVEIGCCTIRALIGSRSARSGCTILKRAKSGSFPLTACRRAARLRTPIGWTTVMCCTSNSMRPARLRSAANCACTIPRRQKAPG